MQKVKRERSLPSLIKLEASGEQIPCLHDNILLTFPEKFKGERRAVHIQVQLQGIGLSLEFPSLSREISLLIDCKSSVKEVDE